MLERWFNRDDSSTASALAAMDVLRRSKNDAEEKKARETVALSYSPD